MRRRGGCSVLGFWQMGGSGQPLLAWQRLGSFTADLFVLAVDELSQGVRGPTVLVLDNASIHRAHVVQDRLPKWAAKGLTLLFLPPCSPALNRIGLL